LVDVKDYISVKNREAAALQEYLPGRINAVFVGLHSVTPAGPGDKADRAESAEQKMEAHVSKFVELATWLGLAISMSVGCRRGVPFVRRMLKT
jgi:hypothetical protein